MNGLKAALENKVLRGEKVRQLNRVPMASEIMKEG